MVLFFLIVFAYFLFFCRIISATRTTTSKPTRW
jgi:hypothetical protein